MLFCVGGGALWGGQPCILIPAFSLASLCGPGGGGGVWAPRWPLWGRGGGWHEVTAGVLWGQGEFQLRVEVGGINPIKCPRDD